jgi:DNA mismatch repair protein MutS2
MRRKRIPELDLHSYPLQAAKSALRCFLIKAIQKGTGQVRIIHGLGDGYMEEQVTEVLEEFGYTHEDFHYDRGNCGATIVHL